MGNPQYSAVLNHLGYPQYSDCPHSTKVVLGTRAILIVLRLSQYSGCPWYSSCPHITWAILSTWAAFTVLRLVLSTWAVLTSLRLSSVLGLPSQDSGLSSHHSGYPQYSGCPHSTRAILSTQLPSQYSGCPHSTRATLSTQLPSQYLGYPQYSGCPHGTSVILSTWLPSQYSGNPQYSGCPHITLAILSTWAILGIQAVLTSLELSSILWLPSLCMMWTNPEP